MLGCKSTEIKHFPLIILLNGPLHGVIENDPLPPNLLKLIQPIEVEDKAFVPEVKFIRIDNNDTMMVFIDSKWQNKLKKMAGTYDYDALKDDYNEYLAKLKVSGTLINYNSDISQESITKYLNQAQNSIILGFATEVKQSQISIYPLFDKIDILMDTISKILKQNNTQAITVLYNTKNNMPPSQPASFDGDCKMEFCNSIKNKLIAIGTCQIEKIFNERYVLAKQFISNYISDNTQIELISPEGFIVDSYNGIKAKDYLFSLSEEDRCIANIKIPTITTDAQDGNKISFIRIVEFNDKNVVHPSR